jgi:hypothetical protein
LAKAGVYSIFVCEVILLGVGDKRLFGLQIPVAIDCHRLQSSSASRFTAGAVAFLLLIQCGERPER